MSEVQETTVMKVARALYELENDQPYVLSWADASKSESMLEYYVEQAECALLASGLPAAIEARDKALERVKALEAALGEIERHADGCVSRWFTLSHQAKSVGDADWAKELIGRRDAVDEVWERIDATVKSLMPDESRSHP